MKKDQPLNIILLGDPAAGKATHAVYLCKKYNMFDLDMGKELRQMKARDKKFADKIKHTEGKGNLTQTNIVRDILKQKIFSIPKSKGILFDGTPKMIGEAKMVAKWLKQEGRAKPLVIYMSIPMKETVRRMTDRKEDFAGKFGKRDDDNSAALERRVKYYRTNITEVVKYFGSIYKFKKISSNAPVPKVRKVLVGMIDEYKKTL